MTATMIRCWVCAYNSRFVEQILHSIVVIWASNSFVHIFPHILYVLCGIEIRNAKDPFTEHKCLLERLWHVFRTPKQGEWKEYVRSVQTSNLSQWASFNSSLCRSFAILNLWHWSERTKTKPKNREKQEKLSMLYAAFGDTYMSVLNRRLNVFWALFPFASLATAFS